MAKQISFGSMFVGSTAAASDEPANELADRPFRLLVLGNFSGHGREAKASGPSKTGWRPVLVDRDNSDEILAKTRPTLSLSGIHPDGSTVDIQFTELDDFHPDRLYDRLEMFASLRSLRERLQKPATFAAAAEEMRQWPGIKDDAAKATEVDSPEPPAASQPENPPAAPISGGDLLEQMLGQSEGVPQRAEQSRQTSEFQRLIAKVVEPHRIAADDPSKQQLIDHLDALIADRMRAILHHPDFQALEAAWREIHFLVRRIETDATMRIYLLDCSKIALASDLEAGASLRETALYKLLAEQSAGTPPWTLIVGNYEFAAARDDVEILGRIALIAAKAGAPFLAGASTTIFGCPSIAATPDPDNWQQPDVESAAIWQQLRQFPQATSLGLAAPRFLLRLPYGRESSPLERFEFEEIPAAQHEDYLWGNSAIAIACLLARTFSETGWNMGGRLYRDLDDLPVHLYEHDGEPCVKPCAEAAIVDRAVEQILDSGVMPLQSFADRGSIRLVRLQSLADPPAALAGRWE